MKCTVAEVQLCNDTPSGGAREHAAECPACARVEPALHELQGLLRSEEPPPLSDDFPLQVLRQARTRGAFHPRPRWLRWLPSSRRGATDAGQAVGSTLRWAVGGGLLMAVSAMIPVAVSYRPFDASLNLAPDLSWHLQLLKPLASMDVLPIWRPWLVVLLLLVALRVPQLVVRVARGERFGFGPIVGLAAAVCGMLWVARVVTVWAVMISNGWCDTPDGTVYAAWASLLYLDLPILLCMGLLLMFRSVRGLPAMALVFYGTVGCMAAYYEASHAWATFRWTLDWVGNVLSDLIPPAWFTAWTGAAAGLSAAICFGLAAALSSGHKRALLVPALCTIAFIAMLVGIAPTVQTVAAERPLVEVRAADFKRVAILCAGPAAGEWSSDTRWVPIYSEATLQSLRDIATAGAHPYATSARTLLLMVSATSWDAESIVEQRLAGFATESTLRFGDLDYGGWQPWFTSHPKVRALSNRVNRPYRMLGLRGRLLVDGRPEAGLRLQLRDVWPDEVFTPERDVDRLCKETLNILQGPRRPPTFGKALGFTQTDLEGRFNFQVQEEPRAVPYLAALAVMKPTTGRLVMRTRLPRMELQVNQTVDLGTIELEEVEP